VRASSHTLPILSGQGYGARLARTPDAAAAQAIGLALHELATNAGKYGALSWTPAVSTWLGGLTAIIFAMSWTESKGPPVSQPETAWLRQHGHRLDGEADSQR